MKGLSAWSSRLRRFKLKKQALAMNIAAWFQKARKKKNWPH
jgi:hypothetical protein